MNKFKNGILLIILFVFSVFAYAETASQIPTKVQLPWAANAGGSYKRTIPVTSQIGIQNGAASWNDGFPPLNFVPSGAGGVPPYGQDMNGALNAISALTWWYSAGGPISYDSTFQTAISGYPAGAIIQSVSLPSIQWRSTTDNNVTNPDTGGAGWVPATPFTGLSTIPMTGSNVTATLAQYGVQVINITGTLTGSPGLYLPNNLVGKWIIENNTTGNYTINVSTLSGNGVIAGQGFATAIYSDGTNIYYDNQENIGIGQTWQAVTRTAGTPYTNSTGRPITFMFNMFNIPYSFSSVSFTVTVGGVTMNFGGGTIANSGSATSYNGQIVIPNNTIYSISVTPAFSYELR